METQLVTSDHDSVKPQRYDCDVEDPTLQFMGQRRTFCSGCKQRAKVCPVEFFENFSISTSTFLLANKASLAINISLRKHAIYI